MLLLLPLLAIVGLTSMNVASASARAAQADLARDLVAVGATSARLISALQVERAAAALVFAEGSSSASLSDYQAAAVATDAIAVQLRAELEGFELPENLAVPMRRALVGLDGLPALREQVLRAKEAVLSAVAFRYRAVIAQLISYRQALSQVGVSAQTASQLRAAAALSAAIESNAQLQVIAIRAMTADVLTPAAQQDIATANAGIIESMETFADLAPPGWPAQLNRITGSGEQVLLAEQLQALVIRSQPGTELALGVDARTWSEAVSTRMELMHSVEAGLDGELVADVTRERDAQRRTIVISLTAIAVLLLIVLAIGLVVARSLTGSLRRLRSRAIQVADYRLPEMVRGLDVENPDPAAAQRLMAAAAEPIPVDGTDEVGEVAAAFNEVTASAVRIAGEQAALRAAIGAILVALSRRLQIRADAMMVSLDALEEHEFNPERLEKLFALDHIAVLIRRLIFNLHVLAGGSGGRPRENPVALADVLRAAGQEIEDFNRVVATAVDQTAWIRGDAIDEMVHLLAELLDNATRFSPPDSQVKVEAKRVGDQLHIQIRDEGVGMSEEGLRQARERIANPRRLDSRTTQHMGLPVVGALAQRLGVKIEFRSVLRQGTWVDLTIPAGLVENGEGLTDVPTAAASPVRPVLAAAATSTSTGAWPALPVQVPASVTLEEPIIFDQLRSDPTRSWFQPGGGDGEAVPIAADWLAAARAAQAAESAEVSERTPSGLPVRQPGERVIPRVELGPVPPDTVVRREPHKIRRQMTAFQHGLGLAGRRRIVPVMSGGRQEP